jgi:hypothetical protein
MDMSRINDWRQDLADSGERTRGKVPWFVESFVEKVTER